MAKQQQERVWLIDKALTRAGIKHYVTSEASPEPHPDFKVVLSTSGGMAVAPGSEKAVQDAIRVMDEQIAIADAIVAEFADEVVETSVDEDYVPQPVIRVYLDAIEDAPTDAAPVAPGVSITSRLGTEYYAQLIVSILNGPALRDAEEILAAAGISVRTASVVLFDGKPNIMFSDYLNSGAVYVCHNAHPINRIDAGKPRARAGALVVYAADQAQADAAASLLLGGIPPSSITIDILDFIHQQTGMRGTSYKGVIFIYPDGPIGDLPYANGAALMGVLGEEIYVLGNDEFKAKVRKALSCN